MVHLTRSWTDWVLGSKALRKAIIFGLVLRALAALTLGPQDVELQEFGVLGKNLASHRGYTYFSVHSDGRVDVDNTQSGDPLPSAFMPPVYTVIVGGALWSTGKDADAIRLLQLLNLIAAAVSMVLMYRLGQALFGEPGGRLAAWIFAVYPATVYQATRVSSSNLYEPLKLLGLLLLLQAVARPRASRAAAVGLCVGTLCLLRAEAVVLLPLAGLWLWWSLRPKDRLLARQCLAAVLAVGMIVPAAWMARNSIAFGRPTPSIATTAGFTLWPGNHEGATGSQKSYDSSYRLPPDMQAELDNIRPSKDYELRRDRVYLDHALAYLSAKPLDALARDAKKLLMALTIDFYDERSKHPLYIMGWALLLTVGSLGIWRYPGPLVHRTLLCGYAAIFLLMMIVLFPLSRFRLPVELTLMLFAAGYLSSRLAAVRDRESVGAGAGRGPAEGD